MEPTMNQPILNMGAGRALPIGFDLRVVHLLHSRVLHDLAGPVGAISNGLELAKESGGALDADAMQLVAITASPSAWRRAPSRRCARAAIC
jgi:hypothetical protein